MRAVIEILQHILKPGRGSVCIYAGGSLVTIAESIRIPTWQINNPNSASVCCMFLCYI